jgi:hypothetical protein
MKIKFREIEFKVISSNLLKQKLLRLGYQIYSKILLNGYCILTVNEFCEFVRISVNLIVICYNNV